MNKIIGTAFICLLIISCNNKKSSVAYKIAEKDLIPEGIAYSSSTNSFYLSSIFKTKIIQINAESGEFKDFISSYLLGIAVLGMDIDETNQKLWACANGTKSGSRISTISSFNLKTAELIKTYEKNDTVRNTMNDLAIDIHGNVYFTNSAQQTIYKINNRTDSLETFMDDTKIKNPNGITISPDNKHLYVACFANGIRVIDIDKKTVVNTIDTTINSGGIDGLKYYKNSLIGIQNGFKSESKIKISRYFLDESGTKIISLEILDQNNPNFDIPTTFAIVNDELFCLATSQLGNITREAKIINRDSLKDVIILKYSL